MPDKGLFDIHCHIVPSVDDGASSAEEAYKMLQMEYRQGVRNIIATPHYRLQMFETPIKTVEHQFLVLKQLARKVAPDLHVYLGCEFRDASQRRSTHNGRFPLCSYRIFGKHKSKLYPRTFIFIAFSWLQTNCSTYRTL